MKSPKSKSTKKSDDSDGKTPKLAFKHISEKDVNGILGCVAEDDVQVYVKKFLKLTSSDCDLKEAALLDYYTSGFLWCRDEELEAVEVSLCFFVFKKILELIEKNMSKAECIVLLKDMFITDVESESDCSGVLSSFNPERAQALTKYLIQTVFQHLSLYHFLFHCERTEQIVCHNFTVDSIPNAEVPFPPPLCESVSEDAYRKYILKTGSTTKTKVTTEVKTEEREQKKGQTPESDIEQLLSELSPDEIQEAVDVVCKEVLSGLESDVAAKLRERETGWINKINKMQNVV